MLNQYDDRLPFLLRMAGRPQVYRILELLTGQGWKDSRGLSKSLGLSLAYTQCLLSQAARAGLLRRKSLEHQQAETVGRKPYVYRTPPAVERWLVLSKQLDSGEAGGQ